MQFDETRFIIDSTYPLLGIGVAISSFEDLLQYRSLADGGLLSWKVSRLANSRTVQGKIAALADMFLCHARFQWIIVMRLMAAGLLITIPFTGWTLGGWSPTIALFLLVVSTLAYNLRCPFGLSGDHQMVVIVAVPLFFASLVSDGHIIQHFAIWFIALQAVLAYVISGWAKLVSATWRSGRAVSGVMSTGEYGNRVVSRMLELWPLLAVVAAWVIIIFESTFPLVFVGVPELTFAFLTIGFLFHFVIAVVMGLNLFFWAFIATYPSILFCTLG